MKLKRYFFLFVLLSSTGIYSQIKLSQKASISVVTCGPGSELYSSFGHSAFRVYDPINKIDKIYNYGTFNFNAPNFYLNFAKGKLTYQLSTSRFGYFLQVYKYENRWVKTQELDLNQDRADVIIPAIYFNALQEFFQTYSKELEGKIIVDVSNPIAPDGNGGFKKIIEQNESAGKILAALIPKNATLIKAFGSLGAGSLVNDAFQHPERKVLFYASDSTNSNQQIEELITSSGFTPYHVGGLDQSIKIEVFGDLHEFGKIGKTVTLAEFKNTTTHF